MNTLAFDIGQKYASPFGVNKSLGDLISLFVTAAITGAGVIVIFLFIMGGLMIIRGAGNNDPKSVGNGKQAVSSAIAGFVIVFVAYFIIRALELITGSTFLTLPSI